VPVAVAAALTLPIALWALLSPTLAPAQEAPVRRLPDELRRLGSRARDLAFLGVMLPIAFNKLTYTGLQGILPLDGPSRFSLTASGVAALFALVGVSFGVAQGLGGLLADRFSPRAVTLTMLPLLLGALVAMGLSERLAVFVGALVAYVLTSSVVFTATLKQAARDHADATSYGGTYGVLGTLTDLMTIAGPLLLLNLYGASGARAFAQVSVLGLVFAAGYLVLGRTGGRVR
jgi:hypothetical protein